MKIKIVEVDENIDTKTARFLEKIKAICILYDVVYVLEPNCEKCGKENSWNSFRFQISREVNDNAIECQFCRKRWVPKLTVIENNISNSYPLMTPSQITNKISQYKNLKIKEIEQTNPALFHWVILHFGSIAKAFKKAGIRYSKEKNCADWKSNFDKIYSHVENLSEYIWSDLLGVSHSYFHSFNKNK